MSTAATQLAVLKAILFVPALRPRFIDAAVRSGVAAVFLDLEDSVVAHDKVAARDCVAASVKAFADADVTCFVRVNRGDPLDLLACAKAGVTGIVLPKVDDPGEIAVALGVLRDSSSLHPSIVATIESARGVLHASAIAAAPGVDALFFGAGDFTAGSSFALTPEALATPAALVSLAAHANHKVALGLPGSIGELADFERLAQCAQHARSIGYSGTPVIHPRQLPVIEAAFSPTAAELDEARRLVTAFEAGTGGASVAGGRLVERPTYLIAQAILGRAGPTLAEGAVGS